MDYQIIFNVCILILLTISIICGIILTVYVVNLHIKVEAIKNSTHNVEYVPMDPNWGSTDKEIAEINEKSELEMPDIDEPEDDTINLKNLI